MTTIADVIAQWFGQTGEDISYLWEGPLTYVFPEEFWKGLLHPSRFLEDDVPNELKIAGKYMTTFGNAVMVPAVIACVIQLKRTEDIKKMRVGQQFREDTGKVNAKGKKITKLTKEGRGLVAWKKRKMFEIEDDALKGIGDILKEFTLRTLSHPLILHTVVHAIAQDLGNWGVISKEVKDLVQGANAAVMGAGIAASIFAFVK